MKLAEIRKVLSKYVGRELPDPPPLPQRTAYGEVTMTKMGSLFDVLDVIGNPPGGVKLEWPVPMEHLRQVYTCKPLDCEHSAFSNSLNDLVI